MIFLKRIIKPFLLYFRHMLSCLFIAVILVVSCSSKQKNIPGHQEFQEEWWKQQADQMVSDQIVARGVSDIHVIEAMKNTPRHLFVPDDLVEYAYNDHPLPIGYGQTISQPYIVALMTEMLNLTGDEKVLEIGTGSGYQAAILSQLADTCFSIEVVKELAELSAKRLNGLGYNNVIVKWGDGYLGWPDRAPFDAIIITAAPEKIPDELVNQLKTSGKMIVPVGKLYQNLLLITKTKKGYQQRNIIPVRFVPMIHPEQPIPEINQKD
jgi:protein-L-isoaspartate(D-aspartate) O-methyltransferase